MQIRPFHFFSNLNYPNCRLSCIRSNYRFIMQRDKFRQLVKKYIHHRCSADEINLFFELIKQKEYDELVREEISKVDWQPENQISVSDIPAVNKVYDRLLVSKKHKKSIDLLLLSNVAAVFLGIIIATIFIFSQLSSQQHVIVNAPYSETVEVLLPDSSRVLLNANSKIKYDSRMKKSELREVWIDGEAYFSVTPGSGQFIVHTLDLDVVVLGTQFNVNNRRHSTRVVLEEGEVQLNLDEKNTPIFMHPGDFVEVKEGDSGVVQKMVDTEDYTSWKNNRFVFKQTSLGEIAQLMKEIHDINIEFKDKKYLQKEFTGTYSLQDPELVIRALELAFDLDAKMTQDFITFE